MNGPDVLSLLDYRRRVLALYAEVRAHRDADPHAAHAHWTAVRDQLFAHHAQSPLPTADRDDFHGLPYYDYDPAYAVVGAVDTDVDVERFEMPTSSGGAMAFERVGTVAVAWGALDLYWLDAYGGGLFLPFRDATAGETTYGGGRYLLDTAKGADLGSTPFGELILDFNFAFHPSCVYDARWTCPLAPLGNRLEERIEAGERLDPRFSLDSVTLA